MLGNLILETCNAPGTAADCNLLGPATGRLPFSFWFPTGSACFYVITDGSQSEWGIGTFTAGSPNKLTRTTVLKNSAGTTARLNFLGTVRIYNDIPAERGLWVDNNGNVSVPGGLYATNVGISTAGAALLFMRDTTPGADAKIFDFVSQGGVLNGRAVNDAYANANNWLTVNRSGYVITSITLQGTAIALNGSVTVNGPLSVTGNYSTSGAVTAAYMHSTGNLDVDGGLSAAGMHSTGGLTVDGNTVTQRIDAAVVVSDTGRLIATIPSGYSSVTAWSQNNNFAAGFYVDNELHFAQMDGAGNVAAEWGNISGGSLAMTGNITAAQTVFCSQLQSGSGLFQVAPNYYLQRGNDGVWRFVEGGNINFSLGPNGDLAVRATMTATAFGGGPRGGAYLQTQEGGHCAFAWDNVSLHYRVNEAVDYKICTQFNAQNLGLVSSGFGPSGIMLNLQDNAGNSGSIYVEVWSDSRLKKNIRPTEVDALGLIEAIPVRAFAYTEPVADLYARIGGRERRPGDAEIRLGLVAQELQALIPEAVSRLPPDIHQPEGSPLPDDALLIAHAPLVPFLVRAVQQLAEQNNALTVRLAAMEARIAALETKETVQ